MLTRSIVRATWVRGVVHLLIAIFLIEPALLYAKDRETTPASASQETSNTPDEFSDFEANGENPAPATPKDSFRLVDQRRETWDSSTGTYQSRFLRDLSLGDPLIMADFLNLTNLRVEILPGRQEFALSKEGRMRDSNGRRQRGPVARHIFKLAEEDGLVVDLKFDREFLYVLTNKGRLFALYMPLARTGSFNHVLPLIHLFDLPESMLSQPESLKLKFAFRAHRPLEQMNLHPDAIYPKDRLAPEERDAKLSAIPDSFPFVGSDMIVHRGENSNTEVLAVLDSTATMQRVHFGLTIVGQLAATAAGMPLLHELPQNEISQTEWNIVTSDPLLMEAFANLGFNYLKVVSARRQSEGHISQPPIRDRFTFPEWKITYQGFEEEAIRELGAHKGHQQATPSNEHAADLLIGEGAGEAVSGTERVAILLSEGNQSEGKVSAQERQIQEALNRGELDDYWKDYAEVKETDPRPPLLQRIFNQKNLNGLAAALLVSGGAFFAGSYIDTGDYRLWALHLSQTIYELLPDALTTTGYTWPYLVSAAAFLSMGVPILWGIGQVTKNLLGGKKRGFDFKRALGWLATVQFARLVKMIYISGIEVALRNPTFITMLQRSMNPFRRIRADSELGQSLGLSKNVYPGLTMPIGGQRWRKKIQEKREIIGKIYEQKLNARSIAVLLATFLVSREKNQDPATVFQLIRDGHLPIPQNEAERKEFEEKWQKTSLLLMDMFEGIASAKGFKSLAEMSVEEFESIYYKARIEIENYQLSAIYAPGLNEKNKRWRDFRKYITDRTIPFLASWGVEQSEILKNSLISQPLANESWRSTWIDYYFTNYQQAIIGGRADFSRPEMLYADPNGTWLLGKANSANVSDTVEQLAIHGIAVPSRNLIDFQTNTPLVEERYAPLENLSLPRTLEPQKFGDAAKLWAGGIFTVEQMSKFGGILWRSMYANRVKMIQSGIVFSVAPRVFLAGQGLGEAFAAWSFVWLLAPFFAFVWPFAVVGNTKLETTTAENYHALKEAQALVNQGLRLNDKELLRKGVEQLSRHHSSLPNELKMAIKEAEKMLADPDFEVRNWLEFEKHRDQVLDLWEAIEIRNQNAVDGKFAEADQQRVQKAAENLRAAYQSGDHSKELSPEQLLVYSLQKPPFATIHHKWLQNFATFFIGVIPSTYIASFLFAHSYREDMNWAIAIPVAAVAGVGSFLTIRFALEKGLKPIAKFTSWTADIVTKPFRKEKSTEQQITEQRVQLQKENQNAESIRPTLENLTYQTLEELRTARAQEPVKLSLCRRLTKKIASVFKHQE